MTIYNDLISAAQDCPDTIAIEFAGQKISYKNLYDQSCKVAAGLQRGPLQVSGSVGIMLPNMPQFLAITYGAFFSGCIVTPINVLLTPRELQHIILDSGLARLFVLAPFLPVVEQAIADLDHAPEIIVVGDYVGTHVGFDDFVNTARPVQFAQVQPDQHMLTLYTSGTTGPSKGVMISDQCMRSQIEMIGKSFNPTAGARGLCVLPLFHAYALNAFVCMAIKYRVTIVLQQRFVVEDCANSLANDEIQWFAGVPTMYGLLLEYGEKQPGLIFPDLEVCLTGGAAMNSDVLSGFERRFEAPIYEGYGLTETTVSVCSNAAPAENRKIGSVGRPYAGMESQVIDEAGYPLPRGQVGELIFRGGNVMIGYLNRPDETAKVLKDGWLHSGDLGYFDEDGFCFIVGRKKDLIIKSGYNIVPLEVEDAVRQAEMVRDVSVVGVSDPIRGERILAAVILKDAGSHDLAREQINQTIQTLLAKYKHPNEIWFVDQFPLGPSGKILKKQIRENWLQKATVEKIKEEVHVDA